MNATGVAMTPIEVMPRSGAPLVAHARAASPGEEPLRARLELKDGTVLEGVSFGHAGSTAGEVVFNTGMVGYPESLTDPSYYGQILVCTYPLIGNYGVTASSEIDGMDRHLESWRIHARAIVVSDYSQEYSHWGAGRSLADWLKSERIPGITGIDTRALTKRLREHGTMLGRITIGHGTADWYDPNIEPLGPMVSVRSPILYGRTGPRVALIDCGAKHNLVRSLVSRGLQVLRVPWDHDLAGEDIRGVLLSNGPGDPTLYTKTIESVRGLLNRGTPVMGVCLGNQLLALAIGARTYKLKYGHRSQNQPARLVGTERCFVTSQNHGVAVDTTTLPDGWSAWFENLNDGTNEGIRHESGRFRSVQFHPEACPGPVDTAFLFDEFAAEVAAAKAGER